MIYLLGFWMPRGLLAIPLQSVLTLQCYVRRPTPSSSSLNWQQLELSLKISKVKILWNSMWNSINDVQNAQAALHDLRAAGFPAAQITVLTGEEGAHRIHVRGDQHGPLAHIVDSMQKVLGDYENKDATRYEEEMLAGHFGIGVTAAIKKTASPRLFGSSSSQRV
jgi:hypothetical protein